MIYDKIKDLCKAKKTSIRQVEIAVGIANGSVARWKKSMPSSDTVKKIADYFDVPTDFLLGVEVSESRPVSVVFLEEDDDGDPDKKELIAIYKKLKKSNKQKMLAYSRGLLDGES